jgi:RNA polymerase sigma-70 factor (ECF subfamily)
MVGLGARHRREVADEALVRQMFDEHGNAMLTYATRLTGDRGAAEDVFQEALVRAWRHPDGLSKGKCNARTWLLSVVDNVVTGEDAVRGRPAAGRPDVITLLSADDTPVPHVRLYRTWRITGVARRRLP